jgi:hypothetical protein
MQVTPYIVIAGDLGGMTLVPGTYISAATIGVTGTLKLDAKDDLNPEWTFNIGAALTTAASSVIEIINPANTTAIVKWNATGAITLGADSVSIGQMEASGAITVGAGALCETLTTSAALNLGAWVTTGNLTAGGAVVLGADTTVGDIVAVGAVTLGVDASAMSATSTSGAISLGSGASGGDIAAFGAVALGTEASVKSATSASGAITLGAGATGGVLEALGAVTLGAGSSAVSATSTSGGAITLGAGAFLTGYDEDPLASLPDLPKYERDQDPFRICPSGWESTIVQECKKAGLTFRGTLNDGSDFFIGDGMDFAPCGIYISFNTGFSCVEYKYDCELVCHRPDP